MFDLSSDCNPVVSRRVSPGEQDIGLQVGREAGTAPLSLNLPVAPYIGNAVGGSFSREQSIVKFSDEGYEGGCKEPDGE